MRARAPPPHGAAALAPLSRLSPRPFCLPPFFLPGDRAYRSGLAPYSFSKAAPRAAKRALAAAGSVSREGVGGARSMHFVGTAGGGAQCGAGRPASRSGPPPDGMARQRARTSTARRCGAVGWPPRRRPSKKRRTPPHRSAPPAAHRLFFFSSLPLSLSHHPGRRRPRPSPPAPAGTPGRSRSGGGSR